MDLVEKAAEAVREVRIGYDGRNPDCVPDEEDRLIARAVLMAIREPTPEMLDAGYNVVMDPHHWPSEGSAIWKAMIDTALP